MTSTHTQKPEWGPPLYLIVHDILTYILHQIIHVMNIVDCSQRHSDRFVGFEKMPQIGSIVVLAGTAIACIIDLDSEGSAVLLRALDPHVAPSREQCSVTAQSRRIAGIQRVNASLHCITDALFIGNPQEMSRLATARTLVKQWHHPRQELLEFLSAISQ